MSVGEVWWGLFVGMLVFVVIWCMRYEIFLLIDIWRILYLVDMLELSWYVYFKK